MNYQLLPVNMPKCPFHNNHQDGAMNFTVHTEEVRVACAWACAMQFLTWILLQVQLLPLLSETQMHLTRGLLPNLATTQMVMVS